MASWSNPSPPAVETSTQPEDVPWSVVDGLIVLIGAFVIYVGGSIVVASIDYPFEGAHTGFWVIPVSYLFLSLGVYVMSTWILVRRRGGTWKLIGYTLPEDQSVLASIGKLL
ncbi:MAG TPA: hypothetical protein VG815_02480, partial [Chloroflexota bacterium]|nr:hypothetical protein [Chloroflexota bacterium]